MSGTRKRATLTEPTKLINASAVRLYVTVVSRLYAAQVPMAHIVTATKVSSATSRSSVLGPGSSRNIVMAAAGSITAGDRFQTSAHAAIGLLLRRRLPVGSRSNDAIISRSTSATCR